MRFDHSCDKNSFPETIRAYLKQLSGNDSPCFVADSALYSAGNLQMLSDVRFITRVPETLKAVKALYETVSTESMEPAALDGNHRYLAVRRTYAEVPQRWLVVYSEAAYRKEVATLEKKNERPLYHQFTENPRKKHCQSR